MELILENVRCFRGVHSVPTRPLTLLVGENSTGKSTFLAMISAVAGNNAPPLEASDFNREPYELGGYDDIATLVNGGHAPYFSVGYKTRRFGAGHCETHHQLISSNGMITPSASQMKSASASVDIRFQDRRAYGQVVFSTKRHGQQKLPFNVEMRRSSPVRQTLMFEIMYAAMKNGGVRHASSEFDEQITDLFSSAPRVKSLAPVRTKPRRTYDSVRDDFRPEGDHVPYLLRSSWSHDKTLREAIVAFGREAGLFSNIQIKGFGKPADPFQMLVETGGNNVNIAGVGYGVSQALPIVVESVLTASENTLLIQQPEVHLHPRAQAALGTFFSRLVSRSRKEFIVETHSDYLLDRARQEVAAGHLKAEDLLILFFDRDVGGSVHVYPIRVDDLGNLVNAPASYRSFFVDEELRLMNRAGAM